MSNGTEREETRKVVTQSVVSSGQCTCSLVIISTDRHPKCRLWTAPPPTPFARFGPDLAPSDFICFQNWTNSWKDGNLLTMTMLSAPRVTGWRTKIKNSSTMEYGPWRITGLSAFLLKRTMLNSDKISCSYSVVNCIRLRTFWTPLVCQICSFSIATLSFKMRLNFFILQQLSIEKSRFRKHSWLQPAYKLLFPSLASYYLHDRSLLMSWRNIIFTFFCNLFKLMGT